MDRVAVVTGGGAGIGFATGRRLAADGCRVAIVDVDGDAAAAAAKELPGAAGYACDVTDPAQILDVAGRITAELGVPQVLVANQGGSPDKRFIDMTPAEQQWVINLNFVASLDITRAFLADMVAANTGRIVYISSDAARAGVPGQAVYAGAKAALIGFAKSLAVELARYAITVNVVCPGSTETTAMRAMLSEDGIAKRLKAHPMRRFAKPDDIATAVQYFASADASFVTGQVISVNGGMLAGRLTRMAASVIEVVSAPELSCDQWSAACQGVPHDAGGPELTNWAAADHTHVGLRMRLLPTTVDGPEWTGATGSERYEVAEIELGAAPPAATPFLYLVRMDVEPAAEDEFNDWYTTDHIANLSEVPGVHSARRFRAVNADQDVRKYLAVYYLDCPSVRQTQRWQQAAHTDWSIRIRAHHRRKLATMFVPTGPAFAHPGRRSAT